MGFLANKHILIAGLVSNRSIAAGVADACHKAGAKLAFTYQNERVRDRVVEMASQWDAQDRCFPCDVSNDAEIEQVFKSLSKHWEGLDGIVHSVAFAPADQLEGDYLEHVTREAFHIAHDISSYSFAALAKAGRAMMQGRKAALVTMTYLGAERVVENYNTMGIAKASLEANMRYMASCLGPQGIRVNAISAGPIRTLAASGVKGLRKMLSQYEQITPLRQNTTIEQVGNTCAFLCSELSAGITGEVIHVDGGFHMLGLKATGE